MARNHQINAMLPLVRNINKLAEDHGEIHLKKYNMHIRENLTCFTSLLKRWRGVHDHREMGLNSCECSNVYLTM